MNPSHSELLPRLELLEQLVHRLVHLFSPDVLEADDTLGVQNLDRRPAVDVPLPGEWAAGPFGAVPP